MTTNWYYTKNGQRFGPFQEAQLRQLLATGLLQPSDLVWKEGMGAWSAAGTTPELCPVAQAVDQGEVDLSPFIVDEPEGRRSAAKPPCTPCEGGASPVRNSPEATWLAIGWKGFVKLLLGAVILGFAGLKGSGPMLGKLARQQQEKQQRERATPPPRPN